MNRFVASGLAAAAFVATTCAALPASAQEYLPAASAATSSGIEGAGRGFQRARTRVRLALELRVDERPLDALVVAALADLEPRAAFGAELRYLRSLGSTVAVSAGAIAYFVPGTLVGPCAGLEVRIPLAKKTQFVVGPEFAVFPIGSDLPDRSVIWQVFAQGGFRVDL